MRPTEALPEEILGEAYEAGLDATVRRAQGSHFTPRQVAARVVSRALDAVGPITGRLDSLRVLDPAMGAGMFLCEALRQIVRRAELPDTPASRRLVASRSLFGVDKDPSAVALARESLRLAIGDPTLQAADLARNLRAGDALFDARLAEERFTLVVGNPPFLGGKRIRTVHGDAYAEALAGLHPPANKNTDLAAHFLRRGFDLLAPGGVLGFVVTNSIAQGDTREGGLAEVVRRGGTIVAATRRLPWPGEAGVVVSLLWLARGAPPGPRLLDDRTVDSIDVFLSEHGRTRDPARLEPNRGRAFIGCFLRGKGFVFDDRAPHGTPLRVAEEIMARRPEAREVVRPFLGGEEVLTDPEQRPHRLVIHFGQRSLAEVRERFPELLAIVEEKVRPIREARQATKADLAHAASWWRFANPRPELEAAKAGLSRVIVMPRMSSNVVAAFLPASHVFSDQLVVVASSSAAVLALLSSRLHETWARLCASTLGDGLRYTPSDVFETLPLPAPSFEALERDPALISAGERFHAARAACLLQTGIGITALCAEMRRDPSGSVREVVAAKRELDRAVLAAYGWSDLDLEGDAEHFDGIVLRRLFAESERRSSDRACVTRPKAPPRPPRRARVA
jgi:hypothetical protein